MYSSLFPVLVLLAKLRPFPVKKKGNKDLELSQELSPEAFVPLVVQCASQPNFKVSPSILQNLQVLLIYMQS